MTHSETVSRKLVDVQKKLEKLNRKLEPLRIRQQKLCEEGQQLTLALRRAQQREVLLPLIGRPVKSRCIRSRSDSEAWMNSATGTLLSVARTRARVDFGEPQGRWWVHCDNLLPAAEPRTQCDIDALMDGTDVSEWFSSASTAGEESTGEVPAQTGGEV